MQISGDFRWKSQVFLPCLLPVRGLSVFCYNLFFWQPACSIFLACVFMTYVWFLLKQQKTAQGWGLGGVFLSGLLSFSFSFQELCKGSFGSPESSETLQKDWWRFRISWRSQVKWFTPQAGEKMRFAALKGDTAPQDTLSSRRKRSFEQWDCKQLFQNVSLKSLPSTPSQQRKGTAAGQKWGIGRKQTRIHTRAAE